MNCLVAGLVVAMAVVSLNTLAASSDCCTRPVISWSAPRWSDAEIGLSVATGDNDFREIPQCVVDGFDEVKNCRQHYGPFPTLICLLPSDAMKRD